MKHRKGITLIELLVALAVLTVVVLIFGGLLFKIFGGKGYEFSQGQRTGLNYKISQKGYFWKTWEGELSLQLTTRNSEGGLVNQVFNYSVSDPALAKEIETLSASGEPITLQYKEYKFRSFRYGDTNYDVVGAKLAKPVKEVEF